MALSEDLRERVVEAVVQGVISRNAAAERFGVSIAIAAREVGRGNGGMILGHQFEGWPGWPARAPPEDGLGLRNDAFVFLESLFETEWPNAGDWVRVEIEALGSLEIAVPG